MPLDFNIGSATLPVSLEIDPSTDKDVFAALTTDTNFPDRDVQLGRIVAKLTTPTATFTAGPNASVSMRTAASFASGLTVVKDPEQVLKALPLDPVVAVDFRTGANDRLILLSLGYTASGSANGTSPIGVLGSATLGVSGQSDAACAVVHRFDKGAGAKTVLQTVAGNLKLPSQIAKADDLAPGTWLIAEIDGSIALNIAANLGYNLNYRKQLRLLGIGHDLGAKIDAAVTATLGFTTSGKFLLVVSRASEDTAKQVLGLQLLKQRKNGLNFGLALTAGITATPGLPDKLDDFLSSVFGVYGTQVVNDLHGVENWVSGDLGSNIAALTTKTAKDLLRKVTGVDPDAELAKATGLIKKALAGWDNLGQNGSTEVQSLVWTLLGNPDQNARNSVTNLLTGLAKGDSFNQTLSDAIQNLQSRQWLLGISDAVGAVSGLALSRHRAEVQSYANEVLNVLNGSVITKLKKEIDSQFNISAILAAANPDKLTDWAQNRLAAFLDETVLSSQDLKQIQKALRTLASKISTFYDKAKSAINSRYSIDFSTAYERNTSDTALIDVEFDMAQAPAAGLFTKLVKSGAVDALFNNNAPVPGVTIHEALLTHEIHTSATTHFAIPFFSCDSAHLSDTVGQLQVEQNGARLVGSIDSKDQVLADRYNSMLELAEKLAVQQGSIRVDPAGTVSYEIREIRPAMSQIELENCTTDFATEYLSDKFPSRAAYEDQFLKTFDIAVSHAQPNSVNNFGDVAISLQVAMTADVLDGWLIQRDAAALPAAQAQVSRITQKFLRKITSLLYFQNLSNLAGGAAAPLLVWSALPVVAGVDWDPSTLKINGFDTGKSPYWDVQDQDLVVKMVNLQATENNLEAAASKAYQRFLAVGDKHNASFFSPQSGAGASLRSTVLKTDALGRIAVQLHSLLFSEGQVISAITDALKSAAGAANAAGANLRSTIQTQLANFARSLTVSLNADMTNLYTKQNLMMYGPMLLVELSRGLAPGGAGPKRSAMLQLLSLKAGHSFDLKQFLTGSYPDTNEVAVGQTVVTTGT